jgi:hypothetical protein
MLTIAVPSLTLVPVMTDRLVKSSRCSQQPQPIKRLVPAPSGRIPLAQAQGRQPTSTVDGGHKVQTSSPSHYWQAALVDLCAHPTGSARLYYARRFGARIALAHCSH